MRAVWDGYGRSQGYVRTTVQQMMERLLKKGLLERNASSEGLQYHTVSPKAGLLRGAVDRFVTESLGGSVSPFVQFLTDARELSDEDFAALSDLVERLRQERGVQP
ncbi:methicillin resistance protein [Fimbriimonas ginsengisoli Gsoil 348]|uniref:Methicillin resistance protein n=1 Tax=Fimbriimonas ginsengisoli Gsoil 348 TaxID=661478 RepID=A0A068NR06_FIMGI|nr:methicillin resistance protein [Fimbriimonas ginsengisoli Gsoil 348]